MFSSAPVITRRSGTSIARGTTIDEYLSEEDNQKLYDLWQPSWPEPFQFSGGITAITCEMVLELPQDEFIAAFGKSKKGQEQAARILDIAKRNAG